MKQLQLIRGKLPTIAVIIFATSLFLIIPNIT
ncbi:hypothetical protein SAMN05216210_0823 [Halopseudomonas salegens]|uniref:Uncharacterized protein n=1 Tax=Halopseudomonas salegens TaxID=1434072 RepID=A0A1H2EKY9_9GAMM|nr:hypothetical protein SAMN05216210_0823 [Halopseudomonas salegens]